MAEPTGGTPGVRPRVAFFGHDCTELTVIKRARALMQNGLEVRGFTFRRERLNRDYRPEWDDLNLGTTVDRRYGHRVLALLTGLVRLARARQRLRQCELVYARNIDMAALALAGRWLARGRARLVYEVLDVQRLLTGTGPVSALLRFFERRLLARTDLLVVSSEAFVSAYFGPVQGYQGRWFLLENKIFGLDAAAQAARPTPARPAAPPCPPDGPWVIAWLGNLRCPKSTGLLLEIARRLGPRVRIHIHGRPVTRGVERLRAQIQGHDNVVFEGEYRSPDDLPSIYARAHFAWAFDWYEEGANSDWLLPNRLYEAGFFGVPSLALASTETGRRVRQDKLGWEVSDPVGPAIANLLGELDRATYLDRRRALLALPRGTFLDEGDTGAMVRMALSEAPDPVPSGRSRARSRTASA